MLSVSQVCSTVRRSKRISLFKDEVMSIGTTSELEASVGVFGIASSYQSGESWQRGTVLLLTPGLLSQILVQTWDHLKKISILVPLMKNQADTLILTEITIIYSV